ncbi:hypothetical protein AAVH_24880 [Aphelenchoides avenae]|nr:hypothetical protein AAVH_24880 [Aphelenchus avenae]
MRIFKLIVLCLALFSTFALAARGKCPEGTFCKTNDDCKNEKCEYSGKAVCLPDPECPRICACMMRDMDML